jgi:hypothetical protein
MFGPLRQPAIRYYQRRKMNPLLQVDTRDLFPELEVSAVVDSLIEKGYAHGVKLPTEHVNQIVQYCENTRLKLYWNPHSECGAIDLIARNWKIVEIARRYLGAEPILWLTQLKWSYGDGVPRNKPLELKHKEPIEYDGNSFHYDRFDFKSLTLFIYLTNVDASSGPHVVIEGTHINKSFSDLCRNVLSDPAAHRKFGERIKIILGPKGTMVFEETSSYHKASRGKTDRLMLSIHYVLQRRPPPDRPLIRESEPDRKAAAAMPRKSRHILGRDGP